MRWKTRLIAVVLGPILFMAVGAAIAILFNKWQIERFRSLTVTPTIQSEPDNRASYYLKAAESAIPPDSDRLEKVLFQPGGFDWATIEQDANAFLAENATVIDVLDPAKDLQSCRMPMLHGEQWDHGKYAIETARQLGLTGDVLFWSTLQGLHTGDGLGAAETAVLNLRLGRDTALAGSFDQATWGMQIFQMASRSLAVALTQQLLDREALKFLEAELLNSDFPEGFSFDSLSKNAGDWSKLANYDSSDTRDRIVRALHLQRFIDLRGGNLLSIGLAYHNTNDSNPLMTYPPPHGTRAMDSLEGMSAGLALLRIGVAVQQYVLDHQQLPQSPSDLVPEYLPELPPNRSGVAFQFNADPDHLEIASPEVRFHASRRALVFELGALYGRSNRVTDQQAEN